MILSADIGATNSRFSLISATGASCSLALLNDDYPDFVACVTAFERYARQHGWESVGATACFAVAGPVTDESVALTNRPWRIDRQPLMAQFGWQRLRLVNDLVGAAAAVPGLAPSELICLQGQPETGTRLVIGPGTGLGVAMVLSDGVILPSEGGHIGFAPRTDQQQQLLSWLHRYHPRVNVERLASGPGLAWLYAFLAGDAPTPPTYSPKAIAAAAMQDRDPLAVATVNLRLEILFAFAGDLALTCLAKGGVFLIGNILNQLWPHLREHAVQALAAFNDKDEYAELIQRWPVFVVTAQDLGLRGATVLAR